MFYIYFIKLYDDAHQEKYTLKDTQIVQIA